VGVRLVVAAAALALASPAAFVQSRQLPDGGFAEQGRTASPELTAWAVLGLRSAGIATPKAHDFLVAHEGDLVKVTDVELVLAAEAASGGASPRLVTRVHAAERRIGSLLNSTIWGVLALRQAGEPVPARTARYLLAHQARSGGWAWAPGIAPDSNDTAAAVEALSALGVRGAPIQRALAYLRRRQNRDGGFELQPGRGSDAQSTAWAIQAFLAAGRDPGARAFAYLRRLRRRDGSFRYSARYAATPVWVTAQVLPALARKPFPLK
jgi:Squalene-hopene cyclase C-terminal domain/Prenyltransferase and squalene oxidase repeat